MPAGPEQQTAAIALPPYPTFRQRLIDDCRRLNAPIPDDRIIKAEYRHRQQVLAALAEAEAAWIDRQRREAVQGR